jgi:hypothetical protein
MKTFDRVLDKQKNIAVNEQVKAATADKARLIAAIKHEYGFTDFNSLKESEKESYKAMINEMWNSSTGLNEKGLAFINESAAVLTDKSTDEQIEKFCKKEIKACAEHIVNCMVMGKECKCLINLKKTVEDGTKKKMSNKVLKQWIYDVICPWVGAKIKSVKF